MPAVNAAALLLGLVLPKHPYGTIPVGASEGLASFSQQFSQFKQRSFSLFGAVLLLLHCIEQPFAFRSASQVVGIQAAAVHRI